MGEKKHKWLEPHIHCSHCGRAIAVNGGEFCSTKCQNEFVKIEEVLKKKRRIGWIMIGSGIMIFFISLIFMVL